MKKTFPLQSPGKEPARVLERLKNEVRKYVQREQRKTPPAEFDRWEFACKVGAVESAAAALPLSEVLAKVEELASAGAASVYIEVLALPAPRPQADLRASDSADHGR